MLHPLAEQIPEADLAIVINELFTPGSHKFMQSAEQEKRYAEPSFPPTPAHFSGILAAYIETDPITGIEEVRRRFVGLSSTQPDRRHYSEMYRESVGKTQRVLKPINGDDIIGEVMRLATLNAGIELARSAGNRLLAAHVVAETLDGSYVSAIAYPRIVHDELPLRIREIAVDARPAMVVLEPAEKAQMETSMQHLLANKNAVKTLVGSVMTLVLPTPEEFDAKIAPNLPERRNLGSSSN